MFRPGPPRDRRELPARFGFLEFEVDRDAVRVSRDGQTLALEPRAFDLLLLLAANPGRVIEKQEIFERLWPDAVVSDNALARVVAHLRRELGDSAEEARVVETVRTRGYRFLPEIGARPDREPEVRGPAAETPLRSPVGSRSLSRRARALLIGGAALAVVLALAFALAGQRRSRSAGSAPAWTPTPVQRTLESGYFGGGDLSPDGSQLVYSSDAAGGLQLFVRPVEGGRELQITAGGGPKIDAAWSPDGRFIAYHDLAADGIWLVPPTGGPPRQITRFGSQPAWFPDGERLVFSSPGRLTIGALEWPATYASTLWSVELRSGEARQLTAEDRQAGGQGNPAVSPDGRWIYFATALVVGNGALWRVAATGGRPERFDLPPSPGPEPSPARRWLDPTPTLDGQGLLAIEVGSTRRIVRIDLAPGNAMTTLMGPLASGVSSLAMARSGRRLVYTEERDRTSLEEVELGPAGDVVGAPRTLTAPEAPRVLIPRYSPDGMRVLYWRVRPGVGPEWLVLDRASGVSRPIPFAPEGGVTWIAPTRVEFAIGGRRVELDTASGETRERPLPSAIRQVLALALPRSVARFPGSARLAFCAPGDAGTQELFVGNVESGDRRQLTHLGRAGDFPFVSRDDHWIAFQVGSANSSDNELWRVSAGGGEPERYPTGPGASWGGGFSPDGERIVYVAHREADWHLAIAGIGAPERLLAVPPETVGYLRWPDWSPDGRHLVYERMHHQASLWTLDLPPGDAGRP